MDYQVPLHTLDGAREKCILNADMTSTYVRDSSFCFSLFAVKTSKNKEQTRNTYNAHAVRFKTTIRIATNVSSLMHFENLSRCRSAATNYFPRRRPFGGVCRRSRQLCPTAFIVKVGSFLSCPSLPLGSLLSPLLPLLYGGTTACLSDELRARA